MEEAITMSNLTIFLRFALGALVMVLAANAQPPANLTLQNLTISSGTTSYTATNSISAGPAVSVNGSASVTFTAGSQIVLQPGFTAIAGSAPTTFHAVIGTGTGGSGSTVTEYIHFSGKVVAIEQVKR